MKMTSMWYAINHSDIEKSMINHEYLKKYNITICLPDYIIV